MPRAAYPHPGTTPRHLNTAPCYLSPLLQSTVPVVCCCNNITSQNELGCNLPCLDVRNSTPPAWPPELSFAPRSYPLPNSTCFFSSTLRR